jgi:hypothetical protein
MICRIRYGSRPVASSSTFETPRFDARTPWSSWSSAASSRWSSRASSAVGVPGSRGAASQIAGAITSGFCSPSMVGP